MKAIDFEAGRRRLLEEQQAEDEGAAPSGNDKPADRDRDQLALVDQALEQLIAAVRARPCKACRQPPEVERPPQSE